jgi:RNA polymerase sigma factor (sigma-70 family)
MTEPTPSPSAQDLALLDQVIRSVTRARRLPREDAEDFAQSVHVRLVERDYHVFTQFAGRSSLRTYLTIVVQRLLLDWQNHIYGKWQPTVMAVRLGPFAIDLERMICRDRFTVDEAIECLRVVPGAPSAEDLRRLAASVSQRQRRRRVSEDVLIQHQAVDFEDPVLAREAIAREIRAHRVLAGALRQLPADDRELIVQRFRDHQTVQSIARTLQADPKALYRRFDRMFTTLRKGLEQHGITSAPAMHAR